MKPLLRSLPICFILATAAVAALSSATVNSLSVGTTFEVDGTELGPRPTAWLEAGGKKIPLKIAKGATDTHMTLTLKALPGGRAPLAGPAVLRVKRKGLKVAYSLASFVLERPSIVEFSPASAPALGVVTIDGQFFGTKKGRVRFGDLYGKVVSWTDTQIKATVPKRAPAGMTILTVENRVGASEAKYGFTVPE
jgi:hypothetical protein